MIKANAHKYSVSAMCRVLQVNRSTYYYEAATKKDESELTADIQEIFRKSRNHYGTRKNWLIAGNRYQDAGLDGS